MKLYSRGQVVARNMIFLFSGALVAALAVFLILRFIPKNEQKNKNNQEPVVETVTDTESKKTESLFPEKKETNLYESENGKNSEAGLIKIGDDYYTIDEFQNISVYDKCNEAVVNINTKVMAYDWFFQPYVQDGGSGSGSIIDEKGYILTNVHVIKGATKIYVSLFDGTQYEATVVGQDIDSDLAVLKFDPPENMNLKTIGFGDSTKLRVGQKVIAIGNPFGMERTMTTGIISGLGRPIQNSNNRIIRNMIQTDSAINPGNSGGPLLDTRGNMIGINTMIMSSSGSSSGVGFAVPAATAKRVAEDLIQYGKVVRGTMAVTLVQNNENIAQYAKLDISTGMVVSQVTKGGNAEAAGMLGGTESVYYGAGRSLIYLGGDIIIKIDDIDIKTLADYYSAFVSKRPGDVVSIVVRRNRQNVTLQVTLGE